MSLPRRRVLTLPPALAAAGLAARAHASTALTVAFAGSMGVLMDRGLSPAFTAKTGTPVHGIGEGAMALAHLLAASAMTADVFMPVSAAPARIVQAAGLGGQAVPVASTAIVLAYSPKSRFAADFAAAKGADWTAILARPGLRFGRTNPAADPQGQYGLYTLQLAALFYKQPDLVRRVAGAGENPAQIFAEPSLLARLQAGQIDATLGYKSAVISQHLPYIALPPQINFSDPAYAQSWYAKAGLTLTEKGKRITRHPNPLVFYAMVLKQAADPAAARAFVRFLASPAGQKIFRQYGYDPGKGPTI